MAQQVAMIDLLETLDQEAADAYHAARAVRPSEVRACDECGEPMVIRTSRSGKFLGCSKYPKCKATKPLPAELNAVTSTTSN